MSLFVCCMYAAAVTHPAGHLVRIRTVSKRIAATASASALPPPPLSEALGEKRAHEIWSRRPPGALPNARRQKELIEWLSVAPLAADPGRLYTCLFREPKLLLHASSLPQLREAHAELSNLLDEKVAPGRFARAIAQQPALLLAPAQDLRDTANALAYFTGLKPTQLSRQLRQEPGRLQLQALSRCRLAAIRAQLRSRMGSPLSSAFPSQCCMPSSASRSSGLLLLSPASLHERLTWLSDRLSIDAGGRLQRVLSRAPLILLASTSTLESRLACLTELGIPDEALGPLVVRTPTLLHTPLQHIRHRATWLETTGVVPAGAQPGTLASFLARQPDYFSITMAECDAIVSWLTSLGMDASQAGKFLADEPQTLTQPHEQLQLRASFFLRVIGGTVAELTRVPHMLTCDLAKVQHRSRSPVAHVSIPLGPTNLPWIAPSFHVAGADATPCLLPHEWHRCTADSSPHERRRSLLRERCRVRRGRAQPI